MFLSYLVHNYVPFRNERILWSYFLRWFAAGWLPSVMLIRTPAILEFQACFFYTFLTVSRSPRVYSFECSVWTKSGLGIRNQNPRSNLGIGIGAETFFAAFFSYITTSHPLYEYWYLKIVHWVKQTKTLVLFPFGRKWNILTYHSRTDTSFNHLHFGVSDFLYFFVLDVL